MSPLKPIKPDKHTTPPVLLDQATPEMYNDNLSTPLNGNNPSWHHPCQLHMHQLHIIMYRLLLTMDLLLFPPKITYLQTTSQLTDTLLTFHTLEHSKLLCILTLMFMVQQIPKLVNVL